MHVDHGCGPAHIDAMDVGAGEDAAEQPAASRGISHGARAWPHPHDPAGRIDRHAGGGGSHATDASAPTAAYAPTSES